MQPATAACDLPTTAPPAPRRRGRVLRCLRTTAVRTALLLPVLLAAALAVGPATGSYRALTVLSGSMAPAIEAGALVVVVPQPVQDITAGQVLTFTAPTADRRVVTHRIVDVDWKAGRPVLTTRGDANPGDDPWQAMLVEGTAWRVAHVVPRAGTVLAALRQPGVQQALVLGTPVVLAASLLLRIWGWPALVGGARRLGRWTARAAPRTAVVAAVLVASAGSAREAQAAFTTSAAGSADVVTLALGAPATVSLRNECVLLRPVVDVVWSTTATAGVDGFVVERRTGTDGTWQSVASAAGVGTRLHRDTSPMTFLTTYQYRVRSARAGWTSDTSPTASIVTASRCLS